VLDVEEGSAETPSREPVLRARASAVPFVDRSTLSGVDVEEERSNPDNDALDFVRLKRLRAVSRIGIILRGVVLLRDVEVTFLLVVLLQPHCTEGLASIFCA
jgi:hypothetical protein